MSIGVFVPWGTRPDTPGWVIDGNGCHIWIGDRNSYGYPFAKVKRRRVSVTRLRYEAEVGPIPEGMQLDHYVCDNGPGGCCNPLHCRPAGHRENTLRSEGASAQNAAKTHCPHGHELSSDNLVPSGLTHGKRLCLTCQRARHRRAYHANAPEKS